jgi:hypothetical protein
MANVHDKMLAGIIGSTDNSIRWPSLAYYVVDDNGGVDGSTSNTTGSTKSVVAVSAAPGSSRHIAGE